MTKLSLTDEQRRDIVRYRLETALSTLSEVESHKTNGFYNTAVNRLYYACYYAATAMLISLKIDVKSHDGVRQSIGQHVVLSGILSPEQINRRRTNATSLSICGYTTHKTRSVAQ